MQDDGTSDLHPLQEQGHQLGEMTAALCINCGSMKFGTMLPCKECGWAATGYIAFTDHLLTEETLQGFGKVIRCLRQNTEDEAVAYWAFFKHVSEHHPEIMFSEIPRRYDAAASALLKQTELPEVMVEDSPRLDAVADSSPIEKFESQVRHHQVQCESCNHTQSFAIWSRINVSVDPWIDELILSRRLFTNKCTQCGNQQTVPFHTLYLNTDKRFAVWLRWPDNGSDYTIQVPPPNYFRDFSADFTLRVVSNPFELTEKCSIFADGYDDILIEFIKVKLCIQSGIDLVQPLSYVLTTKKLLFRRTMTFALFTSAGAKEISYPFTSEKHMLTQVMAKIQPALSALPTDWHSVDRDFVMQILQSEGMMTRLDI